MDETGAVPDSDLFLRKRLAEADLLTGVVGLSTYVHAGVPETLRGKISTDPRAMLRRVMAGIEPSDLAGGAQYLWARARALHEADARITWQRLLQSAPPESRTFAAWAQQHGLAVPYQSLPVARRLAAWSVAKQRIDEARKVLADGLEAAEEAFAGIFGATR